MKLICPNKSDYNWKAMSDILGEDEAYKQLVLNDFVIPNVTETEYERVETKMFPLSTDLKSKVDSIYVSDVVKVNDSVVINQEMNEKGYTEIDGVILTIEDLINYKYLKKEILGIENVEVLAKLNRFYNKLPIEITDMYSPLGILNSLVYTKLFEDFKDIPYDNSFQNYRSYHDYLTDLLLEAEIDVSKYKDSIKKVDYLNITEEFEVLPLLNTFKEMAYDKVAMVSDNFNTVKEYNDKGLQYIYAKAEGNSNINKYVKDDWVLVDRKDYETGKFTPIVGIKKYFNLNNGDVGISSYVKYRKKGNTNPKKGLIQDITESGYIVDGVLVDPTEILEYGTNTLEKVNTKETLVYQYAKDSDVFLTIKQLIEIDEEIENLVETKSPDLLNTVLSKYYNQDNIAEYINTNKFDVMDKLKSIGLNITGSKDLNLPMHYLVNSYTEREKSMFEKNNNCYL